jgi:hypothetical protein
MAPGLLSPQKIVQSKERFLSLLCLILGLLLLVPILNRFMTARIFLDIFLTAIVISMVYTITELRGMKVLVVDDNATSRDILKVNLLITLFP